MTPSFTASLRSAGCCGGQFVPARPQQRMTAAPSIDGADKTPAFSNGRVLFLQLPFFLMSGQEEVI